VSPPGLREGTRSGLIKSDAPAPPAENKPWNWRDLLPSWNKTPAPDIKMAKTKAVPLGMAQPLPEPPPQTSRGLGEPKKVKLIPIIGKAAAPQKGTPPGEPVLVGKHTPLHTGRLVYASPPPAVEAPQVSSAPKPYDAKLNPHARAKSISLMRERLADIRQRAAAAVAEPPPPPYMRAPRKNGKDYIRQKGTVWRPEFDLIK
ncbi:MAG: hypothetical protein HY053_09225, partial [Proteobacteria bacterium]|nr:hypothetical protein [Pseudomonadota bacterium]